jgi:Na+-transporting methylmalonyl-CoA/oxaloacetate decarboxylase gamma subunit
MKNLEKADAIEGHYQKPRMSEKILKEDPTGIGMTVIAMSVVFIALVLLYLVFKQVGVQLTAMQERRVKKPKEITKLRPETISTSAGISEGVYAAIAVAIHLYTDELQNAEDAVLTINKVSRTYSPWSSKIHGLNTYFKR